MTTSSPVGKSSESKQQQILDGARAAFLEHGFAGSSMERIAKTAGVSKGTLYNYFANKESLFVTLIQSECDKGSPPEVRIYTDAPPEPILNNIGQQWLMGLLEPNQRALFRIVLAEVVQFPELGQAIEYSGPAIAIEALGSYLANLNQRGIVEIADTRLAAEQFFALCDAGIMRKMQLSVEEPTAEKIIDYVAQAVRLFLRGYQK